MVRSLRVAARCLWTFCVCVGLAAQDPEKALSLVREGEPGAAEAELRRAVAASPKDALLLGTLGVVLGMQGKLEESTRYLEKALRIDSADATTRRNLASNQFQLGRLGEAKRNLELVLKQRPGDKTATLLAGMVAEESKEYEAAIRHLMSVPELVGRQPKAQVALARALYNTGEADRARATLAEITDAEAAVLAARVAIAAGDATTAERMLLPLATSGRQSGEVFNLLGWCYHKQGKLKEAVAAMDLAIDREPSRMENYYDLASILLSHDRPTVALEAAKKAVEAAPDSYRARMLLGFTEARLRRLPDAATTYARAAEMTPEAPEPLIALAIVLSGDGRKAEAEAVFEKGLQRFPRNARLRQDYGRMLLEYGDYQDPETRAKAVMLLETALALDASLAEAHFQLGKLALDLDQGEEAVQHLETAVKLKPDSSKMHFVLARAYRQLSRAGDAEREIELFERAKAEEEKPAAITSPGQTPGVPEISREGKEKR